jgi:hypothetical protein
MEKELRIFDANNQVLKAPGIRFDLLEVSSGTLIDTQISANLNPASSGSNDWGVKLKFSPRSGPLEVYTSDPTYRYPGNTIQSLEGQNNNRIDIDLLQVPVTTGGQGTWLSSTDPKVISHWVSSATQWKPLEKRAVLNLVSNYLRLLAYREAAEKKDEMTRIAHDWEVALKNLKIEIS